MEHLPIELVEHVADHLHTYTAQPFGRWPLHTEKSQRDIQSFRQVCRGFDHASSRAYAETLAERPFRLSATGVQQLLDLSRKPGLAPYITSLTFADELCFHVDAAKVFEAACNLTTVLGERSAQSQTSTSTLDAQRARIEELWKVYNRRLIAQDSELKDAYLLQRLTEALRNFANLRELRILPEEFSGTLKRTYTKEQVELLTEIARSPEMPSMSLFPGGHRPETLPTLLQAVVDAEVELKEFVTANHSGSETLQVIRLDLPEELVRSAFQGLKTMRITADSQLAYPSELEADPNADVVRRDALARFVSCAPSLETLELNAGGARWEFGVERRHFSLRKLLTDVRLPHLRAFTLQGPVLLDNANEFQELQQFLDAHRESLEIVGFHEVQTRSSAVAVHCAYCVWTDFVVWLKHFPHLEVEVRGVLGSEEFTDMLFSEPLGWIRRALG